MTIQKTTTALFVADSHFRLHPDSKELYRRDRFLAFLEMAASADHLFLLGDIFDFWFDYPHFMLKGYEPIFQALDKLAQCNTKIHFVGGNHDIWAANFLHQRYGSNPMGEAFTQELGSMRIHVCHGDGLLSFDWVYNAFRSIVRNKIGIVLAKSLHPEILFALSTWLSGTSRKANRDQAAGIEQKSRKWLESQAGADWDLTIMGHVHHAFDCQSANQRLVTLPGWLSELGYGLLRDNQFQLLDFEKVQTI